MRISIIGTGRLGGALALALSKKGYAIDNLVARNRETAEKIAAGIDPSPPVLTLAEAKNLSDSEIIFITTQDSEIETVAAALAGKIASQPFVFHTSGSLSSEILQSLKNVGCAVGSIHPLVSVSDAFLGAERFKNVYFCLEGDAAAVARAEKIVADLAGKAFFVETKYKTLYHAAAVMASGHVTAQISAAIEMLAACGLNDAKAQEVLLPLIKSTIENLATQTPAQALTGTFARADVETMRRHLSAIRAAVAPELLALYLQLGLRSAHLAEMRNADAEKLTLMKEILRAENKSRAGD